VNIKNLAGQQLGQYKLIELFGTGGMGAVYSAQQISLDRQVAIKILNFDLDDDETIGFYVERFTREAKTSASLEHPHIVPIYDYGTQGQLSYVVMRLLSGGSLAERIDYSKTTDRPLPSLSETAVILQQLGSALDYAHARGVIHRDVKASNVMFDDHGTAFLVDFGIAKLVHTTSALTQTGMTMGTPLYMAPEQWRGDILTGAADQYALGVVAYSMVTGKMPFEGDTMFTLMHQHLNEPPPAIKQYRDDVPDALNDVINKVMAKEADQRFESASAFASAFGESVKSSGGLPTRFFMTPLPPRPKVKTSLTPGSGIDLEGPTMASDEVIPVARGDVPMPGSITGHEQARSGSIRTQSGGGRGSLVWLAAVLVSVTAVIAAMVLTGGGDTELTAGEAASSETAFAIANAPTETDTLLPTDTEIPTDTPTHTLTDTPTSTFTDIPTFTPTDTSTSTVTDTPIPTDTPTPSVAQLTTQRNLSVRSGPGTQYPVEGELAAGENLEILGISEDGSWYKVLLADGREAWIVTTTVFVAAAGPLSELRIADAPTSTPSDTPTSTTTDTPSNTPTNTPTRTSTATPTLTPSDTPSHTPTDTPTRTPDATETFTITPPPTATFTPTIQPNDTPLPIPTPLLCPGSLPSRLFIGMTGRVSSVDPRPLNVRMGPSTSGQRVDQLLPGQTFEVLEGPVCGNGLTWYRVSYDQGLLEGWIAESDQTAYFIDPLGLPREDGHLEQQGLDDDFLLPQCRVIVEDDFNNLATMNDWFVGRSSRSDVRISNGEYQIALGDVGTDNEGISWGSLRGHEFGRVIFEAVIRVPQFSDEDDARTGLWVRYLDEDNFIAFMIQSDSRFRIAIWEPETGYRDLVRWRQHPAINTGLNARNTLRVEMIDHQYSFYINGVFAESTEDDALTGGRVAFFAASHRTPALFALEYFRACQN
jgi:serine/threonine protein kinase